ncbi:MAG: hypothetical protein AB7G93_22215 [Bdellovibrionales bacterium]
MTESPEKLRILETLVDELLKDKPQEKVVTNCMDAAGIPDSKDPLDRINSVLAALRFEEPRKRLKDE